MSNLEKIEQSLLKIKNSENKIYFLVYDTKENARAAVKHIYDIAKQLHDNNFNVTLLAEDSTYTGVSDWLGDKYDDLKVAYIKDGNVEINIEDVIVVPEYYSNILPQLKQVKANKVMLIQQRDFIFETLPIGSNWLDFGFDKAITTNNLTKKYIQTYFPETLTYVIPPIIGDNFSKTDKPIKPYIAISCRDRTIHRRLISEFYIKYPQLRWITFRDMVSMGYDEFADTLKETMVSLWVDDESTFGTFPMESMKCGVPVVGKIPNVEPEWLGENGFWTYSGDKLVDILGSFILSWLEGSELEEEVLKNMVNTVEEHTTNETDNNIISVFNSINNKREELLIKIIEKNKEEE